MQDLPLYRELLTDARTMSELGGPLPENALEQKLRGIVDEVRASTVWYSVIEADGVAAGTVCIWEHPDEVTGEPISEIGWMVLPSQQAVASRALPCVRSSSARGPSAAGA